MRIGFIGVGGISRIYLRALGKLDQTVAAVCDLDEDRLTAVAQEQGAAAYADYREMLQREWLDAVFIAIPPAAHTTQVIEAAEARCAVFVTQPIGLSLDEALRVAGVLKETGVVNQVGYRARYSDIALEARVLARNRPLTLGFGRFLCRMSPSHPWWGKKAISGGQLIEQSGNVFDLLRYFMGEIESVQTFGHSGAGEDIADFEDSTACNLRFASGAVGNVVSTYITRADESLAAEFVGRDFFLRVMFDHRLTGWIDGTEIDYHGEETGYHRQIDVFLRAVREKNQALVRCPYEDAVKTLAVTIAATKSLETGEEEKVPSTEVGSDTTVSEEPAPAPEPQNA
jgi:predicted dehydrogenase